MNNQGTEGKDAGTEMEFGGYTMFKDNYLRKDDGKNDQGWKSRRMWAQPYFS